MLECARCEARYPVADGIVRLLPPRGSAPEDTAREAEREQRDREATGYDRLLGLRLLSWREIPLTLAALGTVDGEPVVEVGCGTGRFTAPLFRRGARIVAVDHSLRSLEILRAKLSHQDQNSVLLVQADAARLPVRDGWARRVLSAQMLEHLPSGALRQAAVEEMARVLVSEGRLALSAYWYAPALRPLLRREGAHSGRIFYHRFHRRELTELLSARFVVERSSGALVYVLLVSARKKV